jgi:hypothetical protein
MDKKCVKCGKRSCPMKKMGKLEKNLKKWFRAEKLSLPDGALLLDRCLDEMTEKIMKERKRDRDAVILLKMRRAHKDIDGEIDEDVEDEFDEEDGKEHIKNRKENENRKTLWYIG